MAFVRIDQEFYDHPKWATAPGDSIALWVAAMAWCNRNESWDGYIPANKLAGLVNVRNVKRTIADLCQRVAFIVDGDGYLIHDYPEYQQNEKVRKVREARSEAGRKGAESRWRRAGKPMASAIANEWQTDGNENAPVSENRKPKTLKIQPTVDEDVDRGPIDWVFETWQTSTAKPRAKLDPKRRRIIAAALKGYPVEDLLAAVQGWANSPHHRGENDRATIYNDLELLLRDAKHIEQFRDLWRDGEQIPAPKIRSDEAYLARMIAGTNGHSEAIETTGRLNP